MRALALAMACLATACASTYVANPNDPVDMAAELGDRGRQYVGMGAVCDAAAGGAYRQSIVEHLQHHQQRLGALSGLVNRAYRGEASETLALHMQGQMRTHGLSASEFCGVVVRHAEVDFDRRATNILGLEGQFDGLALLRESERARYAETPSFDRELGYMSWLE